MAGSASSGHSGCAVGRCLRHRLHVTVGEFLDPASELERDAVWVMEIEGSHIDTGMHGRRYLSRALVVIEHRADAHPLALEPLAVLVELLRGHVERQVVHGADGADDVTDARY